MKERIKRNIMQLTGLCLCIALSAVAIYLHTHIENLPEEKVSENASTSFIEDLLISQDPSAAPDFDEYDPLEDILPNPSVSVKLLDEYIYSEEIDKYAEYSELSGSGYKLSGSDYDSQSGALALVTDTMDFSGEFSLDTYNAVTVVTETDDKGSSLSHTETVEEDCPLLRPYYGYVIYTTEGSAKLLDSRASSVLADITGYEPVYRTTLAGDPLFKKGDKYYFYCDPETSKTVFYSDVEADSYTSLSEKEPTAAPYFNYDYYILLAKNYYAEDNKQVLIPDISVERPEEPAMVEYIVNEDTFISLTLPDSSYSENHLGLYPFYSVVDYIVDEETGDFKINQILWGYMDEKGDVVIEPKYLAAYPFSEEGYAVIVDKDQHLCIINKWGSVVCNPYYELYYTDTDAPDLYSRVIYFNPDTYGIENTGMFSVDNGYVRFRKKFVDTSIGDSMNTYITKNETQAIVSVTGKELAYPADYDLVSYSDGLLLLEKDGYYGYMNTDGIWIIEPILRVANPFSEGLAVVAYRGDKLGVIDTEGNVVMPFIYSHIENCSGGVITAYSSEYGWTVYNKLSTAKPEEEENPVLDLKYRTLARAKYDYYSSYNKKNETESGELIRIQ